MYFKEQRNITWQAVPHIHICGACLCTHTFISHLKYIYHNIYIYIYISFIWSLVITLQQLQPKVSY